MNDLKVCVDFGSTFTKALLVDLSRGEILAQASHPTTLSTDVLDGYDACLSALAEVDGRAATAQPLACSSAGGGLRIAVVGNEELVTAEAGRRVALSSGGKVVGVLSIARGDDLAQLGALTPDVVLLTGGTDGGNQSALVSGARQLRDAGWAGPVVVAGNNAAYEEVAGILAALPVQYADNVVPRIGVLHPDSARHAIRELFLSHVIGGKQLSKRADFRAMVVGPTPDVVLTGVELLAGGLDDEHPGVGDVVVVDVGGATTDVYSVVALSAEEQQLSRDVVGSSAVTRTVEGDLGMRWSALSTWEAGAAAEHPLADEALHAGAVRRHEDPAFVPTDAAEREWDERLARLAVTAALRRHAGRSRVVVGPDGRVVERTGTDLRDVALVVGSGGVLRHGSESIAERVFAEATGESADGWQLPRRPRVVVDSAYVLAAAGLLAHDHPHAAYQLVRSLVS